MTLNENDTVSLAETSGAIDPTENADDADRYTAPDCSDACDVAEGFADREEYERLIKTKYKDFFAEDAQKLINRRFKKYKVLEEKVKVLEENARSFSDVEALLVAERERAVKETEERMNRAFKANRSRADENAVLPRSMSRRTDVTRLTKGERAELASRALKGEKISF